MNLYFPSSKRFQLETVSFIRDTTMFHIPTRGTCAVKGTSCRPFCLLFDFCSSPEGRGQSWKCNRQFDFGSVSAQQREQTGEPRSVVCRSLRSADAGKWPNGHALRAIQTAVGVLPLISHKRHLNRNAVAHIDVLDLTCPVKSEHVDVRQKPPASHHSGIK